MPTIDSPQEAQSVARLIQQGQITGSARDTALQALRDFDAKASAQSSTPAPSLTDTLLRQIALGGRAAAEGVVGALSLPDTVGTLMRNKMLPAFNAASHGINSVLGTHIADLQPESSYAQNFSNALTSAGAYTPATSGEQMGSAITRGVTGALTGGGVLGGVSTVPNAVRMGVSGATGAASSEGLRQAGVGPLGQFVGGIVGGLTPAGIEEGLRAGGSLAGNLVRPLTKSGQNQIAGNVMLRQATNPTTAAANLDAAAPIVPGSLRTSGEASQDIGLLSLEKGLRGRNPAPFGDRLSEQNTARQTELSDLAGTESDVTAAENAREVKTGALREAAFSNAGPADVAPVIQKIDATLAGPIGKRDIPSQALNWLRNKLIDSDGNIETDPENLYAVRQDLNDAIAGKLGGEQAKFRLAQGQLIQIRGALDDAIDQAAPGFKDYLTQYAALSKPINRMTLLQELQAKAAGGFDNRSQLDVLAPGRYSRALDSVLSERLNPMTADQIQRLEAIRQDLQNSQAVNGPLLRAPGSDTFQNLSIAQALGSGPASLALQAKAPMLGWLYRLAGTDAKANDALTRAMLEPKVAADLIRDASRRQTIIANRRQRLPPTVTGLLGASGTFDGSPSAQTGSAGSP